MTTPNTQPAKLDKAIERDAEYLRLKDDASIGLDGSPGNDTSKFAFESINTLIKRLKEVENERDHEHSELIRWMVKTSEWCEQHKEEITALRAGYKQALEKLKQAQHEARCEYQNKYGKECFVTRFDDVLSTPLAIAMMKGSQ